MTNSINKNKGTDNSSTERSRSVPTLRFPEFSGEWNVKSFKDIVKINQGLQIAISERLTEKQEGAMFYITNEFLRANSDKKYFIKDAPKSVICEKDDILMTRTGNTGKVVTNVEGAFHNNFFKIAYPKIIVKEYLVNFLNLSSTQNYILRLAGTSTIPDLNHSDFYKIEFTFPQKEEQQKIATFLTAVDDKIEQLTKKKTLLEQYKKGVMQQLFSQKLRFKDDKGNNYPDWEEKKVKDYFDNIGGTSLEKFFDDNADCNVISIGNYTMDGRYNDNKQRIELNEKTKSKLLFKNNLVMVLNDKTKTGDIIGSTILIEENDKFIYNQRSERLIIKDEKELNPKYAWTYLNSTLFRKMVFAVSQGGTQIYVNFSQVKKLTFVKPFLEEQTQIANFLSATDDKIALVNTQLENTVAFKKGLLQQLFV